jgi:hypothetical protein
MDCSLEGVGNMALGMEDKVRTDCKGDKVHKGCKEDRVEDKDCKDCKDCKEDRVHKDYNSY